MRRKQIGIMGAFAIAAATAMGGAVQVNATPVAATTTQQNKKEAVPVQKTASRPVSVRNRHGGFSGMENVFKHRRKDYRNQRQYRKWRRSNPNA